MNNKIMKSALGISLLFGIVQAGSCPEKTDACSKVSLEGMSIKEMKAERKLRHLDGLDARKVATAEEGTIAPDGNETSSNTTYGYDAGHSLDTGFGTGNTLVGVEVGFDVSDGDWNTFLGDNAGYSTVDGSENTFLGDYAGYSNVSGSYNIFIGNEAGSDENGSNKLYIENGATSTPLIYGEFDNQLLRVNGALEAIHESDNPTGDGLMKVLVLTGTNTNLDKGSDAGFALTNGRTGKAWNFRTTDDGDGFAATINGTGGTEFRIVNASTRYTGANLYLGSGAKCENGVWSNRSSRSSKENIQPLETQAALQAFHQLQPMTYNYKTDKTENYVGFIAEDVPELVATKTRDSLSAMDMVAVLTKVVQVHQERLEETQAKLKAAQAKITRLEAMQQRVAKMETILSNLALQMPDKDMDTVSLRTR
jgi:uncharacterized protein (DUF1499 family)